MTTTIEATQAPEVAELSEDTRKEIVALREGGMTVAELKARFPQLTSEQIREVLPAGNARERKQREVKAKVTEAKQGVGGRSGKAKSEPKATEPKPDPKPRYVEDTDLVVNLSERALACRQVVGRNALAEALDTTGSAVWRFEQGRIHPPEVEPLKTGLTKVEERIAAGEFVKAERQPKGVVPGKADLLHRVEVAAELLKTARGDKSITKAGLVDSLLAVLDPPQPAESE
jgi:hypothetical protein